MTHYAGLDVSVKETAICVIDAGGAVVWQGKVPTRIEAIAETLALACCRFRGHDNRIVTKGLEITNDETEVQPRVQD